MASFNSGFGNMLDAQQVAGGASLYAEIIQGLPSITGPNSEETINYVRSVLDYCTDQIVGG